MDGHMILYRGSLKSCNYHCSYCPFSKRPISERELAKDREQWNFFVRTFRERGRELGMGALMVVPYGEALIHPWYWEGLAGLSALSWMDAAGAQTNLSFPVRESLDSFLKAGGKPEKLRLWATFHPEMTTVEEFTDKCRQLKEAGIVFSAGAVGVPENAKLLLELRKKLPEEIYLWVNRMDGLRRPYTETETEDFLTVDPYFLRELAVVGAEESRCRGRLFVEGDGKLRICNISPVLEERWEELCRKTENSVASSMDEGGRNQERNRIPEPKCGCRRCSCYLAYGGREEEWNRMLFGSYPLFRVPRRPKAVFLDIMGTLLPDKEEADVKKGGIPAAVLAGLEGLFRDGSFLFFATTLPFEDAVRSCGRAGRFFSGGIFAGGAHILLEKDGEKKEWFSFLDKSVPPALKSLQEKFSFRALTCENGGKAYKVTLLRPFRKPWKRREAEEVFTALPDACRKNLRYFVEGCCLQIVDAKADKEKGVRMLCGFLGIRPEDAFAMGNSEEDAGMIKLCGGKEALLRR